MGEASAPARPDVAAQPEPAPAETKKTYRVKTDLDPNMIVPVKNGFPGVLVYRSRRTGELYRWQEFGAEQDMELSELKTAKNSCKEFFVNAWFLIDDPEVLDWLGVSQYYKHTLSFDQFDAVLFKDADSLKQAIDEMSNGQKRSLAYRAKQLIADNTIDSLAVIHVLEESLGVELIEY